MGVLMKFYKSGVGLALVAVTIAQALAGSGENDKTCGMPHRPMISCRAPADINKDCAGHFGVQNRELVPPQPGDPRKAGEHDHSEVCSRYPFLKALRKDTRASPLHSRNHQVC
jgi:hypothetical protein